MAEVSHNSCCGNVIRIVGENDVIQVQLSLNCRRCMDNSCSIQSGTLKNVTVMSFDDVIECALVNLSTREWPSIAG